MLSIKNYLQVFFIGLLSVVCLWAIAWWPNWWLVLPVLLLWSALSVWSYYLNYRTEVQFKQNLALLITTIFGITALFVLLEWDFLRWFLLLAGSIFLSLQFLRSGNEDKLLSFQQKPYRRMKMMLWVFNVYAFFTFLFAVNIFFPVLSFFILTIIGGLIASGITLIIFKMYFAVPLKSLSFWGLIVGLIMVELLWLLHLLPLGYLVLGALAVWFWFIIQLFIRFYLSPQGIDWRRQRWFLLVNFLLLLVLLVWVVRWI